MPVLTSMTRAAATRSVSTETLPNLTGIVTRTSIDNRMLQSLLTDCLSRHAKIWHDQSVISYSLQSVSENKSKMGPPLPGAEDHLRPAVTLSHSGKLKEARL